MTFTSRTSRKTMTATVFGSAALLAALAACGGGSSGGGTQQVAQQQPQAAATVSVHSGPLGSYLTDGNGRTLYLFAADTSSKSMCSGDCAQEWPPFTTSGAPKSGSGAKGAMLATSSRSDGTTQVTYAGHPLYYYADDESTGDMKGEGKRDFGGLWTVVSPAGAALPAKTGSSGGGTSSTPSESSNGWG